MHASSINNPRTVPTALLLLQRKERMLLLVVVSNSSNAMKCCWPSPMSPLKPDDAFVAQPMAHSKLSIQAAKQSKNGFKLSVSFSRLSCPVLLYQRQASIWTKTSRYLRLDERATCCWCKSTLTLSACCVPLAPSHSSSVLAPVHRTFCGIAWLSRSRFCSDLKAWTWIARKHHSAA